MTDYSIDAWLGDAEATDEQRDRLTRAAEAIEARYPIPDDGTESDVAQEREAALSAAAQIILGDSTITQMCDAYDAAYRRAMLAHASRTGALIAEVQTTPKIEIHRSTGLSRPTIDKAVG